MDFGLNIGIDELLSLQSIFAILLQG